MFAEGCIRWTQFIEVEASIAGIEQGYSGWVQLDDGRIFVVNYTDDTAAWGIGALGRWNSLAPVPQHPNTLFAQSLL